MAAGDRPQIVQQPPPQLDLRQIVRDAQSRWLRPPEICEVLRSYTEINLKTSPAPPYQPPSGSLFLFDRKALRYFRKDGHNWRKKKDGKTVKEAHERLKVGSVNALHCYYAHGEENMNFQRRSYWLLEGAHEHIVLVHYLEALQGNRSSVFRLHDQSLDRQLAKQAANSQSPEGNSPNSLDADGANSGDEADDVQIIDMDRQRRPVSLMDQLSSSDQNQKRQTNQTVTRQSKGRQDQSQAVNAQPLSKTDINELLGISDNDGNIDYGMAGWDNLVDTVQQHPENSMDSSLKFATWEEVFEQSKGPDTSEKYLDSLVEPPAIPEPRVKEDMAAKSDSPLSFVGDSHHAAQLNHLSSLDSFGRWVMNEIAVDPVSDSDALLSSTFEDKGGELDTDFSSSYEQSMPSIQMSDQKFKIVDFSPDWADAYSETKVLVTGQFLVSPHQHNWCCMFGEVEARAEILGSNVLRCICPPHPSGNVPFYITCNDRTACSEIRDFEFRGKAQTAPSTTEKELKAEDLLLQLKFVRMLCSDELPRQAVNEAIANKIRNSFKKGLEQWDAIAAAIKDKSRTTHEIKDSIFDVFSRLKLQEWLIRRAGQDGKGPSVCDKEGQGMIHIVSALGFDWAIPPLLAAGVLVNFRDLHGWTALHWAAHFGREDVILALIGAKAVPELLTDPTPAYPNGQTAADVASCRGYPGIAGYLAEASLEHHLSVLTLKDGSLNEIHYTNASLAGESAASRLLSGENVQCVTDDTFLKQSLSAVRRATQAAALIQSAFREFTFRRKQEEEEARLQDINSDNVEYLMAAEKIQKAYRGHKIKKQNSAATKIQSKFRGWKGRHEYLQTRQRIIKIQAIVRGFQARRQYRKILWSVGVLEKVVLRWHRGRHGLRGFQAEEKMVEGDEVAADDEFLQEGRKQKEHVIESAVQRVQDMVHDPEARAQYARMRAVSQQIQAKQDDEFQNLKPLASV
ncbi:calmodulin-binding transcription activator 3 [Selaginella moellendorffii]|uniref:calmodulin-binding transcription activator 3 n=1 Tax=Selaginella moellendorffii TaxID=88036 RepID=UPI000D1C9675|nr:calmodulin-binding transcription activator 3 [Selaginella moellendorffii]|eukprot:XP_024514944.1 calmodulin-binding transcription activator 3 [Selaginella moellendorffii]